MIVKNESRAICRCLESVKPFITYWVIVDTGSTDGTQAMIQNYMKDIPGELHELPWVDFAHNRNEALRLAKGKTDYLLFMDADDVVETADNFIMPPLNKDGYSLVSLGQGAKCLTVLLVNNRLEWHWEGVLHEFLHLPDTRTYAPLPGITVRRNVKNAGFRSQDPKKFYKDAEILEAALQKEPDHARYQFYLAQSYSLAQEDQLALQHYEKRATMGGWDQEVFWSLFQIAIIKEKLKMPFEDIVEAYYKAYHSFFLPRAEPLYYLAKYYRKTKNYEKAYQVALQGISIPEPDAQVFISDWMYEYGMALEFAACAYMIKRYAEAQAALAQLLTKPHVPPPIRTLAETNQAANGRRHMRLREKLCKGSLSLCVSLDHIGAGCKF